MKEPLELQEANSELTLLNEELHASNIETEVKLEKCLKNTQEEFDKIRKNGCIRSACFRNVPIEPNTPLGAIQAPVNNMVEYIENLINLLSYFLKDATPEKIQMLLSSD